MKECAQSASMQGREHRDAGVKRERRVITLHQDRSVTTAYGEMLTRELFIGEPEEGNYFKCY